VLDIAPLYIATLNTTTMGVDRRHLGHVPKNASYP